MYRQTANESISQERASSPNGWSLLSHVPVRRKLVGVYWERRHNRVLYFSVQMIQLGLLAGLGLLQFLGEPLVGVLECGLGVVVDDGTVGGLDTGVDLKK